MAVARGPPPASSLSVLLSSAGCSCPCGLLSFVGALARGGARVLARGRFCWVCCSSLRFWFARLLSRACVLARARVGPGSPCSWPRARARSRAWVGACGWVCGVVFEWLNARSNNAYPDTTGPDTCNNTMGMCRAHKAS